MSKQLEHASEVERQIVRRLVSDILAKGYRLSVYDGGEFTVKFSTDATAILDALASTDSDNLIIRRADKSRVGFVMLIWGNDTDLISDHTDSAEVSGLIAGASALADRLAA